MFKAITIQNIVIKLIQEKFVIKKMIPKTKVTARVSSITQYQLQDPNAIYIK